MMLSSILLLPLLVAAGVSASSRPNQEHKSNERTLDEHKLRSLFRDGHRSMPQNVFPAHDLNDAEQFESTSKGGKGGGRPDYLGMYEDHLSMPVPEVSTYFATTFKHLSLDNSSSSSTPALAFTVTESRYFSLLSFALNPENSKIIKIRPITKPTPSQLSKLKSSTSFKGTHFDDTLKFKEYIPPLRRRDGPGFVGINYKFSGWEVLWRGVSLEVWETTWIEGYYSYHVQNHILVTDLPPALSPIPSEALFVGPASTVKSAGGDGIETEERPSLEDLQFRLLLLQDLKSSHSQSEAYSSLSSTLAEDLSSLFLLEISSYATQIGNAILVFDQSYWRPDQGLWQSVQRASWGDVILEDSLKKQVRHEYKSFFDSEGIYKELGVPWKRGIIFLGPPGNGKTISLKAIMKDAGVPVLYVKSFHTYMGDEGGIRMVFERARAEAPCLLVFEDIDSLITDQNRSFFLNEVDGLEDNDGLLMLGTTNHFDRLDPALSNRPSRFDRKYNFPNPSTSEREAYAVYWQNKLEGKDRIDFPDSLKLEFANKTAGFSFSHMKEAFVSTLLLLASDESKTLIFGETLLEQVKALRKEIDEGNRDDFVKVRAESVDGYPGAPRIIPGVAKSLRNPIERMGGRGGQRCVEIHTITPSGR